MPWPEIKVTDNLFAKTMYRKSNIYYIEAIKSNQIRSIIENLPLGNNIVVDGNNSQPATSTSLTIPFPTLSSLERAPIQVKTSSSSPPSSSLFNFLSKQPLILRLQILNTFGSIPSSNVLILPAVSESQSHGILLLLISNLLRRSRSFVISLSETLVYKTTRCICWFSGTRSRGKREDLLRLLPSVVRRRLAGGR